MEARGHRPGSWLFALVLHRADRASFPSTRPRSPDWPPPWTGGGPSCWPTDRTGRASSGPVEAINGEHEAVDRVARGFRNFRQRLT